MAQATEDVANAISSLLQAAPQQKLHIEQIEYGLSSSARPLMHEALDLLIREGTVDAMNYTYYALR